MGKHICLFYGTEKDLRDLVVPYFREGLSKNEFCLWVAPESLGVEGAKALLAEGIKDLNTYMEKGQLEILDHKDWYIASGRFDSDNALRNLAEKEKQALQSGYSVIRASGDVSWLQKEDWEEWAKYEETLDGMIQQKAVTALCTYPDDKFDASEIFLLTAYHSVSLRNKDGRLDPIKNV